MPFISLAPTAANDIVRSLRFNTNLFLPLIILGFGVPGFIACSQRAYKTFKCPDRDHGLEGNADVVTTLDGIPALVWLVLSIMLFPLCAFAQWWVCVLAWRKAKQEWVEESRIRRERESERLGVRGVVAGI